MRTAALLLIPIVAVGCATATTSGHVEQTLESTLPGCRFERDDAFVLGRTSLTLLRWLSGAVGAELDADSREILHGVRRVEVASYHADSGCRALATAPPLSRRLAAEGWRAVIAAAEDEGELTWVLTREGPGGSTSGILVVTLSGGELEVVRLDGDIDGVLMAALTDDPSAAGELASSVSAAGSPGVQGSGMK